MTLTLAEATEMLVDLFNKRIKEAKQIGSHLSKSEMNKKTSALRRGLARPTPKGVEKAKEALDDLSHFVIEKWVFANMSFMDFQEQYYGDVNYRPNAIEKGAIKSGRLRAAAQDWDEIRSHYQHIKSHLVLAARQEGIELDPEVTEIREIEDNRAGQLLGAVGGEVISSPKRH